MKYLYTDLFNEFECIGGECPETCCGTWNITVDKVSYTKYQNLQEPNRSWVLGNINENANGERNFILSESNMCPFLNEEGWCLMYRNISPDALCDTCRYYPREGKQHNDLVTSTVSLTCPHVGSLLLSHKDPIQFTFTEDDEVDENKINTDWTFFNEVVNGWITVVDILQNRSLSFKHRITITLDIASIIDENKDRGSDIRLIINNYLKQEVLINRLLEIDKSSAKVTNYGDFVNSCFDIIKSKKSTHINSIYARTEKPNIANNEEFNELKKIFDNTERNDSEYENIVVQLLFLEWMDATNGKPLYNIVVRTILYLILLISQEMYFNKEHEKITNDDRALIIARLARVLEHSDVMNILVNLFTEQNGKEAIYGILGFFEESK